MKGSFILGILGGVFAILVAMFELIVGSVASAFGLAGEELYALAGLCTVAGCLGIIGGAIGKKLGGVLMVIGSILALIGASAFGILPFILMLVGGVLALREKTDKSRLPKLSGYEQEKK